MPSQALSTRRALARRFHGLLSPHASQPCVHRRCSHSCRRVFVSPKLVHGRRLSCAGCTHRYRAFRHAPLRLMRVCANARGANLPLFCMICMMCRRRGVSVDGCRHDFVRTIHGGVRCCGVRRRSLPCDCPVSAAAATCDDHPGFVVPGLLHRTHQRAGGCRSCVSVSVPVPVCRCLTAAALSTDLRLRHLGREQARGGVVH